MKNVVLVMDTIKTSALLVFIPIIYYQILMVITVFPSALQIVVYLIDLHNIYVKLLVTLVNLLHVYQTRILYLINICKVF